MPPGNSEEVRETRHPSLRGASRSPSVAFWGGRDVADAAIDDDDAVRPKNVPWNWPMLSIGTTGEEGARGRQRRRALRSDDGTILDRAAWARALLSPRRRRRRGGQGQRRQKRDPRRPREQRRTRRRKCASHNGWPVGRGGVAEQRDGDG